MLFAYLIGLITNYINNLNLTAALFRDPVFVPEVRTRPLELDAAAAAVRGCRIGCIACMVVLGDAHSLRPILAADEPLG